MQSCRIALYSHDTMGLGHMRRNLLIAQALSRPPVQASILMITGSRRASAFEMPPGVDCLTLPALYKSIDGQYKPRHLGISLQALINLRAKLIQAALEAFEPDVLIVDNVPRGAVKELDPALEYLHKQGHTRCVLGLRDVLDDPATVRHEWHRAANEEAIRDYYDAVWVYGDPTVYNLVQEYQLSSDVAAKVRYTGYLNQCMRLQAGMVESAELPASRSLPPGRLVLCAVGGGQDGAGLAEAFAQAELPPETNGIILTGPFMPPETQQRLRSYVAINPRMQVFEFVPEPTLLVSCADRVVAMGGYNTVCEMLSFKKHALIVPRVKPRREQLIRAERLHTLGLLDMLHPDEVNARALSRWLAHDTGSHQSMHDHIDMNGLARLPHLIEEMLRVQPYAAWSQYQERRRQYVA